MGGGSTHGSGLGAKIVGHSWKIPLSGRFLQSLLPPPQFAIPDSPISDAPIIKMTVPVTMGGNSLLSTRGLAKDMPISRNEQMSEVPRTLPYASGQGPRVIVPSAAVTLGQVPSLYMALKSLPTRIWQADRLIQVDFKYTLNSNLSPTSDRRRL